MRHRDAMHLLRRRTMSDQIVSRTGVCVAGELAQKIDDFRYENRIPTQAKALRILLEKGLEAVNKPIREASNA